jgi:hypothetical protein
MPQLPTPISHCCESQSKGGLRHASSGEHSLLTQQRRGAGVEVGVEVSVRVDVGVRVEVGVLGVPIVGDGVLVYVRVNVRVGPVGVDVAVLVGELEAVSVGEDVTVAVSEGVGDGTGWTAIPIGSSPTVTSFPVNVPCAVAISTTRPSVLLPPAFCIGLVT